jgi:hypothetical protein
VFNDCGTSDALLYRKWQNRVSGRDWFDFEWYIRTGTRLNLLHLSERARQSGHWPGGDMSPEQFKELLQARIGDLDIDALRQEVSRFVRDTTQLKIWSRAYFLDLSRLLRC